MFTIDGGLTTSHLILLEACQEPIGSMLDPSEDNNGKIDQLEDTQNDKGDEQQNETNNEQYNNADNELHNNTTNNQSNDNVIISDLMGSILISRKTHASTAHPFCSKEANTDQKQRIKNRQNVVSFFYLFQIN